MLHAFKLSAPEKTHTIGVGMNTDDIWKNIRHMKGDDSISVGKFIISQGACRFSVDSSIEDLRQLGDLVMRFKPRTLHLTGLNFFLHDNKCSLNVVKAANILAKCAQYVCISETLLESPSVKRVADIFIESFFKAKLESFTKDTPLETNKWLTLDAKTLGVLPSVQATLKNQAESAQIAINMYLDNVANKKSLKI